jgi:radical SAM protein with 4Fe4S-binding SPASM domain
MGCFERDMVMKFSPQEIDNAVRDHTLLTMEVEFNSTCNFKCIYCYSDNTELPREMSVNEWESVILQAKGMGVRSIIILGGEPTLYDDLLKMIKFIRAQGMSVEMFTNGAGITADLAQELFELDIFIALKMNTFKKEVQNLMSGNTEAYTQISTALKNLQEAGYPGNGRLLAVSSVICKYNYDELETLWRWLRQRNIHPYFEMITPQGKAKDRLDLEVAPEKVRDLFERLSVVDKEFGYKWEPKPPLVGTDCKRHLYSLVVNPVGDIFPCVGVSITVGNVRDNTLSDIIRDSEVLNKLRNYKEHIKGPCKQCDVIDDCYGCRGAAYHMTGDYLESDPMCWRKNGNGK